MGVQRILDTINAPAYARNGRMDVLAVNRLGRAMFGDAYGTGFNLDLGFAAVRVGDFASAHASWEHFLRLAATSPEAPRARAALETLTRLMHLAEAHADA